MTRDSSSRSGGSIPSGGSPVFVLARRVAFRAQARGPPGEAAVGAAVSSMPPPRSQRLDARDGATRPSVERARTDGG